MQTIESPHFSELIEHNSKLLAVFSPRGHVIVSACVVIYLVLDYVFYCVSIYVHPSSRDFFERFPKFLLHTMNDKNKT